MLVEKGEAACEFVDGRLAGLLVQRLAEERAKPFVEFGGDEIEPFDGPIARHRACLRNETRPFLAVRQILNDSWTFRERRATLILGRFGRFQIVSIGTATLTVGLFAFFNSVLGWHYIFSQLVAIGLATILNFSLNFKLTWPRQANLEGITGLNPQLNKVVNFEIEYEETPGC